MSTRHLYSIKYLIFSLVILSSCQSSGDQSGQTITTDIVQNPISADGKGPEGDLPKMEFQTISHDFGLVIQGERVSHTFSFKNTGGSDLVISGATASCGCTVPKYSKEPIKPGKTGEIEVIFNSDNREGNQHKTIKLLTNCQPNTIELSIKANVIVNP